ncbi:MAG: hypothetical protein ACK56F_19405, partial [bacterium]
STLPSPRYVNLCPSQHCPVTGMPTYAPLNPAQSQVHQPTPLSTLPSSRYANLRPSQRCPLPGMPTYVPQVVILHSIWTSPL